MTYAIFSNYGYGFELTCYAEDQADAKRLLKEYRDNEPQYAHKIRRVKNKELI